MDERPTLLWHMSLDRASIPMCHLVTLSPCHLVRIDLAVPQSRCVTLSPCHLVRIDLAPPRPCRYRASLVAPRDRGPVRADGASVIRQGEKGRPPVQGIYEGDYKRAGHLLGWL